MQWVHDPNQSKVDNLNNVKSETSRFFRNEKKAYLKAKFEEIGTNSKIKKIIVSCIGTSLTLTLRRRDLNAPCSGCLPEFFLGVFKFQCMFFEKKSYLIDFSFKFNAIKFGSLLMKCFIRKENVRL
jgi:hypothetical protein